MNLNSLQFRFTVHHNRLGRWWVAEKLKIIISTTGYPFGWFMKVRQGRIRATIFSDDFAAAARCIIFFFFLVYLRLALMCRVTKFQFWSTPVPETKNFFSSIFLFGSNIIWLVFSTWSAILFFFFNFVLKNGNIKSCVSLFIVIMRLIFRADSCRKTAAVAAQAVTWQKMSQTFFFYFLSAAIDF